MIGSSMSGWKAQAGAMGVAIGGQTAKGMVLNTLLKNVGSAKKRPHLKLEQIQLLTQEHFF